LFELRNRSPFAAQLLPTLGPDGREHALVVVKGTYKIPPGGKIRIAEEQVPLTLGDQYYGEPHSSSIQYASDIVPAKTGTDVILMGHAYPPKGKAVATKVTLEAGPLQRSVAVVGDRHWQRSALRGIHWSAPQPFSSMPLVYERAYGGSDRSHPEQHRWVVDGRNPVGRGLVANHRRPDLSQVALPNLENPDDLIQDPDARPAPFAFSFIAPGWESRRRYAGTYDRKWQESRFPLSPEDFDSRFYNCAPADLISPNYFTGGERIRVTNASPQGDIDFLLPEGEVRSIFYVDGTVTDKRCELDTVVLEPNHQRLQITWRAAVCCHRKVKYVTGARVVYSARSVSS